MDTLTAIGSRRSVKKFNPDHALAEQEPVKIVSLDLFVAIGKGIGEACPRPGQLPKYDIMITDHY